MPLDAEKIIDDRADVAVENPNRAERIDDRQRRGDDRAPRDRTAGNEKGRDMRSIIKKAIKETATPDAAAGSARQRAETADRGADASLRSQNSEGDKPGETAKPDAPQAPAASAAPAGLSKEVKAVWDTLPSSVQSEFARREADAQQGAEQLKARLKPFDDALAPVRGQLKQLGKTDAEAVDQLIKWQAALAGPNKVQAFRALAQAHGLNLAALNPQAPNPSQTQQPDPLQAFRPFLDPLAQKVNSLETEFQRRDRERVQGDIASLSKDKPHFEKVRFAMGHLINTGQVQATNSKEAFDEAYARACRADPEVFALIQQEEQTKREADAKATRDAAAKKAADDVEADRKRRNDDIAKARRAGVGPRAGSPSGMAIAGKSGRVSVGESIREAVKETSARA